MDNRALKKEKLSVRFRRNARRLVKRIQSQPLNLDDIPAIKISLGTTYKAVRNRAGNWNVYKLYAAASAPLPYGHEYTARELVAVNLPVREAMDVMQKAFPAAAARGQERYNHPVQVAKLIG